MRRGKRKFENVRSTALGAWIPRKSVKEATLGMTGESIGKAENEMKHF